MAQVIKRSSFDVGIYLLCVAFLSLSPFVNNINGASIKFFAFSLLGPAFYSAFLVFFLLFGIIGAPKLQRAAMLAIVALASCWFLVQVLAGFSEFSDIQYFVKFFFPSIVFIVFLYALRMSDRRYFWRIKRWMVISAATYCLFILFSFVVGYHHFEAKPGYYGFIDGLNDLIFLLVLSGKLFLEELVKRKYFPYFLYLLSLLLTASKVVFAFIPIYLGLTFAYLRHFQTIRLNKVFVSLSVVAALLVSVPVFSKFVSEKSYLADWDLADLAVNNPELVYSELTYGRSQYLLYFIAAFDSKTWFEKWTGSGIRKSYEYTSPNHNKGGIEMDPPDVLNIFGYFGIIYWFGFFILLPLFIRNYAYRSVFLLATLYSCFGGHLVMNAISGSMFGVILALEFVDQQNRAILLKKSNWRESSVNA